MPVFVIGKTTAELFLGVCVCVFVSDPASISSVLIKCNLKKLDGMKVAKTSLRGLLASTTRGR